MPIRVETPAGIAEFPDGMDPSEIEAALSAQFGGGGPETPAPEAAPAKRNVLQEQIGFAERGETMPMLAPLTVVGAAAGPVRQFLSRIAPRVMRQGMGALESIRRKFPTVDFDEEAVARGLVPGSQKSIDATRAAAQTAGQAVPAAGRAADAAGAAPIRISLDSLRQLHQRAGQARMPDQQQRIVQAMREFRKNAPGGMSVEDALVAKTEWQNLAKGALQGATDPRAASGNAKIARAIAGELTSAVRQHPGVSNALDESQKLMALSRAMEKTGRRTSILRDAIAAGAGTAAGAATGGPVGAMVTAPLAIAANRAVTSPQVLGRAANLMRRVGQTPTPNLDQSVRALLLEMLSAGTEPQ